eukprot:TRINITY_DN3036_c0_g1_i1.p1 TRINITY_DN3036_c0_g1~~TRINITY_DN3036_c0_g1_i1.p1  ORF type:complete len:631 (+),score=89.67 TRINITY_DN3036_c0_g1_i1:346-2238(+)
MAWASTRSITPHSSRITTWVTKQPHSFTALPFCAHFSTGEQSTRVTLQHQDKLPRLAIPSLAETTGRYLDYVKPLITPQEYEHTAVLARAFANGEGQRLQEELVRLDNESNTSWLNGFWDTMYATIRDPLPVNVSPYLVFKDDPLRKTQVDRAAGLIHAAAKFHKSVLEQTLAPDMEKDSALCMAQYSRFFGSARLPRPGRDICPAYTSQARHVLVTLNNQLYILDAFYPTDSGDGLRPLSEADLRKGLEAILQHSSASNLQNTAPISVLTADNRDSWAANYAYLSKDSLNEASLAKAASALFNLVLEPEAPTTLQRASELGFYGDTTNRWFDKLQMIVCGNGVAAINIEHTPVDGHTALRFVSEVPNLTNEETFKAGAKLATPSFKELQFNIDNHMNSKIEAAHQVVMDLVASNDHVVLKFDDFGAKWIKQQKMSPDGFVQMAFQQAYYKLTGTTRSTYESAMTKKFHSGRTETLRSVTAESVAWTRTFSDANATKAAKLQALRVATEAHVKRMNEAKAGKAVDRHLWVLNKLAQHKQQRLSNYSIPAIYQDPSYASLTTSVLSTSNCGSDHLQSFGFGAVVPEGLGLGYMIHNDVIPITVSSFQKQADPYAASLRATLRAMHDLCNQS